MQGSVLFCLSGSAVPNGVTFSSSLLDPEALGTSLDRKAEHIRMGWVTQFLKAFRFLKGNDTCLPVDPDRAVHRFFLVFHSISCCL